LDRDGDMSAVALIRISPVSFWLRLHPLCGAGACDDPTQDSLRDPARPTHRHMTNDDETQTNSVS